MCWGASASAVPGAKYEQTPESAAGCLGRIFFTWTSPVFIRGNAKVDDGKGGTTQYHLDEQDMFPLVPSDEAAGLVSDFEKEYAKQRDAESPGAVYQALKTIYWTEFFWIGVIKFFNSTLQFAPSIILNFFLQNLEDLTDDSAANDPPVWLPFVLAGALFLFLSTRTLTENAYFHGGTRLAFRVRSALTTAIYRKALRLSPAARQGTKEGSIVQLMNVDAERFNQVVPQLHIIWDGIFQIVGYMTLLTVYIGPSSFAGFASMLILIPINLCLHGTLTGLRRSISALTDKRVQATNEALQGVRAIKLYGWERAFETRIAEIRRQELDKVSSAAHVNAGVFTFMQSAPIIVGVVTLLTYAAVTDTFKVSTVFTALTILTQLRFPLMFYPMVIMFTSAASVSLARIEKFMAAPEVGVNAEDADAPASGSGSPAESRPDSDAAAASSPASPSGVRAAVSGKALADRDDAVIRMRGGTFWWCDPAKPVVDLLGEKEKEDKKKKGGNKDKGADASESEGKDAPADAAAVTPTDASADAADAAKAESGEAKVATVPVLDGITFGVPKGKLLAIVGAVGSGKTALCSALLGELYRQSGSVDLAGSVAFCAQRSWILNATVEKNITFAEGMDRERYDAVLAACQLNDDLATLRGGDQCEIGERGVNLSGGQKQRVSVARAAYSSADVVILDDILSALDPEVGARLFEECIVGTMAGRTRVMVTNQVHVLEHCDFILEVERDAEGTGRIARVGTFREMMEDDVFRVRVEQYAASAAAKHKAELEAEQAEAEAAEAAGAASPVGSPKLSAAAAPSAAKSQSPGDAGAAANVDGVKLAESATAAAKATPGGADADAKADPSALAAAKAKREAAAAKATEEGKLTKAETKEQGAVSSRFYFEWLRAGAGSWWVPFGFWLLFVSMLNQVAMLASNLWVSFWASDTSYSLMSLGGYMGVYAAIGVGSALMGIVRLLFFVRAGVSASRRFHDNLFSSVIYAPMVFFDTTPLGRVMARFSKDMDAIDFNLASQLGMLAMTIFLIIGSLASVITATPWFAVAVVPLLVVYYSIANYFRNVSRECKRVDSITRSPIYAHFGETLGGLSTIRAYGQSSRFSLLNEGYVNANTSAWYTLRSCDRWLSVRLEILGNVIVLLSAALAAVSALTEAQNASGSAGQAGIAALAGFALSFSLTITSVMSWAVRTLSETENLMNSVERVVITADETPQEPRDEPDVPDDWASVGAITFSGVRMRYRKESPEVLHGVDFSIRPGEKVGIVGRSGSGKSTIMQCVFRIPQDDCVSGTIAVDGRDTKTVGLHTLRQRLSIIPQECVMFSGTLRDNLDPAGEVRARASSPEEADRQMLAALVDVGLDKIADDKGGLGANVSEFGENWSAGERQLLSLARVLLRPTKILCLDEVSSSVDADTDQRMHETILDRFADRTVLTIAHRLHTIIRSDRVIVMDDGRAVEFDHPHTLLSDPDSRFSSLVRETGAAASGLIELAKQSYEAKHGATPPAADAAAAV